MKTALRAAGILIGLTVLGIVAAAIILPLVIDPNDYRERIAAEVKARTGRELTLAGPLELSVFPWLGLALNDATLGNAPGFGDEPFVAVQEARVKVRLLPLLLRRDLDVDTVVLREPRIHLVMDKRGRANWEDLTGDEGGGRDVRDREDRARRVGDVALGGVEISAGEVVYDDQRSGARTRVRELELELGRLTPGATVPMELSALVELSGPGIRADVSAKGQVKADLAAERYEISGLDAGATLKGEGMPKDGLPVRLRGDVQADLAAGKATAPKLELAVLDARLSGSGSIDELAGDAPSFSGTLELAPFSPRQMMQRLGAEVRTADETVLAEAKARADVRASAELLEVRQLSAALDDTQASGSFSVRDFSAPRVRFDLKVGALDLDRYLAPGATEAPRGGGGGKPKDEPPPDEGLRLDELGQKLAGVDLSGSVALAGLKVAKLRMSDLTVTLRGKNGALSAEPLRATLYDGTLEGSLRFDARGREPVIALRQTVTGSAIGPLLQDLNDRQAFTGQADVALDVRARGAVLDQVLKTLAGNARFDVRDGTLKDVNIDRAICQARAAADRARGKETEECDPSPDSRFETLRASAVITDGVLRNDDLVAVQPRYRSGEFYRITGKGKVNLPRQEVDYDLRAVRTRSKDAGAPTEEKGRAIPVRVAGTFGDLSVRPDVRALAESEVKEQLKDRVGDKLEEKEDDSELERQGKELLRGILGR